MLDQINQYEGLVKHQLKKYAFTNNYDDLYQAGMLGLVKAIKKYDIARNTSFLDYAYFYIKGEILKALHETYAVKMTPRLYKIKQEANDMSIELTQKLGRKPTLEELSYILGHPKESIEQALNTTMAPVSLDNDQEQEQDKLYHQIASLEKGYDAGILDLKTAIEGLEAKEQQLIKQRYYADYTQQETAKNLDMTQVQVSRAEQKILKKLKTKLTITE